MLSLACLTEVGCTGGDCVYIWLGTGWCLAEWTCLDPNNEIIADPGTDIPPCPP